MLIKKCYSPKWTIKKEIINGILQDKVKQDTTISNLKEESAMLNSKLENMIKYIRMLNNGSGMLDEILEFEKMSRNLKGMGVDMWSMSKKDTNHLKKFVPHKNKTEFQMFDHMS